MDTRYLHLGDHIAITKDGHISLLGIALGDSENKALHQLDELGLRYDYDHINHYIQDEDYSNTIVMFDSPVRFSSLHIVYHFTKEGICEQISIGNRDSTIFTSTGLRWLADSIELFSSCLKFTHEYSQVSKSGIIKVFHAGSEYIFIELNNGFHIFIYSEKQFRKRVIEEKILPTRIVDNMK